MLFYFLSHLLLRKHQLRWDSQQASPWNKEHKQCSIQFSTLGFIYPAAGIQLADAHFLKVPFNMESRKISATQLLGITNNLKIGVNKTLKGREC